MMMMARLLRAVAKAVVPRPIVRAVRHFVNGTTEPSSETSWETILGADGYFHWEDLTFDLRRDANTLFIRDEILNGGEYSFATSESCVVVDIGMNIGDTPLYFARMPHVVKVYGYEPLRETYDWAVENINLNPCYAAKITVHNAGVTDRSCSIVCDLSYLAGTGGAAVEIVNADHLAAIHDATYILKEKVRGPAYEIAMRDINEIIAEALANHPGHRIVVKCDAEGAEWKILPALDRTGLLRRISVLMVEYHYRPPTELLSLLTRNGFLCFLRDLRYMKKAEIGNIYAVRAAAAKH